MKQYKLVDHTADIRLHLEASSLAELFCAAIQGMAEIIAPDITKQTAPEETTIFVTSSDITNLLIDFMSNVLTQTHINYVVYHKVDFEKISEQQLKATISGTKVDHFDEDIKAVTYHEVDVKKNKQENFETVIVFDI